MFTLSWSWLWGGGAVLGAGAGYPDPGQGTPSPLWTDRQIPVKHYLPVVLRARAVIRENGEDVQTVSHKI